jgi:hypothetical protein
MDQHLCSWNATQVDSATGLPHANDWLMDPFRLLKRLLRDDLDKATRRAAAALRTNGRVPGHPDVLTQLTLGTWRFLLPDRDPGRRLLWEQALRAQSPLRGSGLRSADCSMARLGMLEERRRSTDND